jgi:hypothetical protein
MRRLLLPVCALAAFMLMPSSASAWTPQDCLDHFNETGYVHEDCQGWWNPPPPPPAKEIPVCREGRQLMVPADQVLPTDEVLPNIATPCSPPPPPPPPDDEYVPPVIPPTTPPDTPNIPDTDVIPPPVEVDDEPEVDIGEPVSEVGGNEQVPSNPQVVEMDTDTLPYTGAPVLALGLLGGAFALAGFALRRRLG